MHDLSRSSAVVPFLDLAAATRELRNEIDSAIGEVLDRGVFLRGTATAAFEEAFARYCGVEACVGVSNGLDALHLALRAWKIGPGDEVIVPAHTFIATWLAVTYAGATVVPVDVTLETMTLDPERVAGALSTRTKAIIPVHLYGLPAHMSAIRAVAAGPGIRVLEDAAQAHGARLENVPVGAMGDAAAFSFYPAKNLGALGDGGAVTSDDRAFIESVRMLANYGSVSKYEHRARGFNCRLDELQAAVLAVKLRVLDEWNQRRRRIATRYLKAIEGSAIATQFVPSGACHVWHLFVMRSSNRDGWRKYLAQRGIETLIHYPKPPHLQRAYAQGDGDAWPNAVRLAREVLSLPIGPHLTEAQIDTVAAALRDGAAEVEPGSDS